MTVLEKNTIKETLNFIIEAFLFISIITMCCTFVVWSFEFLGELNTPYPYIRVFSYTGMLLSIAIVLHFIKKRIR